MLGCAAFLGYTAHRSYQQHRKREAHQISQAEYERTKSEIAAAQTDGRYHLMTHELLGMCCFVNDPLEPSYVKFCARHSALRDLLPPHAGDRTCAVTKLLRKGIQFSLSVDGSERKIYFSQQTVEDDDLEWLIPIAGFPGYPDGRKAVLDLSNQPHITDAGIRFLRNLPGVSFMNLRGTRITDAGARALRSKLRTCGIRR